MKKIVAFSLCVILLICMAVPVSAAAADTFLLQEYDVVSDEVFCYGKALPAGGQFEVSDGARIIDNVVWSTLEQERIPVTLYCLVDCATSLSDRLKQQREDILLNFSSLMAEEDSMVLATVDAVLTESKPMNTKDARDTAIHTISGQVWYTNLYDGISQAVKTLHTSTAYHTNRCLVIISDGHDDGKSSVGSEAVQKQILESGIPVYTVILDTNNSTEKELTLQRNFAEESLGGFMSFPDKDGISASATAQKIWSSIKGAHAIRIGVKDLQNTGADQQILLRYHTTDTRYEDTILIRAVDLPVLPTETTEATEATAETTEETEPNVPADGASKELMIGVGIAVILLGIGIALFFLAWARKNRDQQKIIPDNKDSEIAFAQDAWDPDSITVSISGANSGTLSKKDLDLDFTLGKRSSVTLPVHGQCHVTAIAIRHPEVSAEFSLTPNMEATFGRNEKASIILNPNDKKLSGCHGCFLWDSKNLFVQDRDSTNGTAVNNEFCPKHVWLMLEEGAVLTAGSYEYRIHFQADIS